MLPDFCQLASLCSRRGRQERFKTTIVFYTYPLENMEIQIDLLEMDK
jgi:hypothetical protein